jgi:Calx-beta domain
MGLILTGTSVGGLAEAACASNHITASLVGLPPEAISRPFFYSAEPESGSTDALFTIRVFGDDCSQPTIGVDYATGGGTAQPGTDYTITAGRAQLALPVHEQVIQTIPIPVQSDDSLESVVESTDIVLSNPSGARLAEPFTAPLFVIDSDGPSSRVALDGGTYAQSESQLQVRIPVFRAGAAAGSTTVSYSITPGGTNPAQGADYVAASPGPVSFGSGERVKTIDFSLVNDDVAEPPETLTISLNGAEVVAPTTSSRTTLREGPGW